MHRFFEGFVSQRFEKKSRHIKGLDVEGKRAFN